ncbi:MAG: hydrogenase expression/formation protein HypE [Veillonellaceae bacterium]|nr:hydrogenase expression/formation protein HypE [Veillonellaceae bacterium]
MNDKYIQLAHGSGGKLSRDLVEQVMWPAFANPILGEMHDGAKLDINGIKLAFTTDSFVVKPLFFKGGDIGKLAVCGTVNDLAMTGAKPLYLSVGMVIEEGFALDDLKRIVKSMQAAAIEAGVQIVTGDTKVVEKGAIDSIYLNTTGVGAVMDGVDISPQRVKPGQDIILSGYLGDHSLAVMSERHGLILPESVSSDCAPLNHLVEAVLAAVPDIAVLRDPTRGGLATALNEIAAAAKVGILLNETTIPVRAAVKAACDILGYDPLYMANEGKLIAIVDAQYTKKVLEIMQADCYGKDACVIGRIVSKPAGQVGLETAIGGVRLLDMLIGDQLPRIC